MKTTLNKIREHEPCANGWKKLLTYLGKTEADDEPLSIITILDSNGLEDAIWCLWAVEGYDREIRLFAVWCARQVQHLMTDQRSLDALDVAERYANGEATEEELAAAWTAADAVAAAWTAANTAAANAAAWAAAVNAADAAESAAWTAANAAAANAAANAAAWAAAWAAARDVARDVADARYAAWAAQEKELRRICEEVEE